MDRSGSPPEVDSGYAGAASLGLENAPNESSEMVTHIQLNKVFSFPAHLQTGETFQAEAATSTPSTSGYMLTGAI